jgi:hypothetical protein
MIAVKVTMAERALLTQRAALVGLDVGSYVRTTALAHRLPHTVVPPVNIEIYGALARTAANLNQIATHLNAGHILGTARTEDLRAVLTQVGEAVRLLRLSLLGVDPET